MIYIIKNDQLHIEINSIGAQIMSIKKNNEEFLWQGDEKFWANRAPILFPLVGRIENDNITIDGQDCNMTKHGFIRDFEWEVAENSADKIIFKITHNDEFLKKYPYKFEVLAEYWLEDVDFKQKYTVKNLDAKKICYGFGLHPAFFCNKSDGEKFEDFIVDFNKKIDFDTCTYTDKMMVNCNEKVQIMKNENQLQLNEKLFEKDAIITMDVNFDTVSIINKNKGKILDFKFSGFDIFAIWKPKNAPFVCLEPWTTISGNFPYQQNYEQNKTVKFLEVGQSKEFNVTLSL